MMEAKDREYIQSKILRRYPGFDPEMDIDWDVVELVFDAGKQIGFEIGIEQGKAEGRREVVEWLERCKKIKVPKYQLEAWGIKGG